MATISVPPSSTKNVQFVFCVSTPTTAKRITDLKLKLILSISFVSPLACLVLFCYLSNLIIIDQPRLAQC